MFSADYFKYFLEGIILGLGTGVSCAVFCIPVFAGLASRSIHNITPILDLFFFYFIFLWFLYFNFSIPDPVYCPWIGKIQERDKNCRIIDFNFIWCFFLFFSYLSLSMDNRDCSPIELLKVQATQFQKQFWVYMTYIYSLYTDKFIKCFSLYDLLYLIHESIKNLIEK